MKLIAGIYAEKIVAVATCTTPEESARLTHSVTHGIILRVTPKRAEFRFDYRSKSSANSLSQPNTSRAPEIMPEQLRLTGLTTSADTIPKTYNRSVDQKTPSKEPSRTQLGTAKA